jgi:hypothetical protein
MYRGEVKGEISDVVNFSQDCQRCQALRDQLWRLLSNSQHDANIRRVPNASGLSLEAKQTRSLKFAAPKASIRGDDHVEKLRIIPCTRILSHSLPIIRGPGKTKFSRLQVRGRFVELRPESYSPCDLKHILVRIELRKHDDLLVEKRIEKMQPNLSPSSPNHRFSPLSQAA